MSNAYERLLEALEAHGSKVKITGKRAVAQCPAHEDRTPSLSLTHGDRAALVKCHAGCQNQDIVDALGWTMADLFDDRTGSEYEYRNLDGSRNRMVTRTPEKQFRQRDHAGQPVVLFNLAQVVQAVADGKHVILTEGEKDARVVMEQCPGEVATTAPMGASNFKQVDVSPLAGAHVVAIPDQDQAGERWSADVAETLSGVAAELSWWKPKGKDAAEHFTQYDLDDFVEIDGPKIERSSWHPQPLDDILDGTYQPEVGTLMQRTDGIGLLYAGRTHDLHGESESGKSLIVQAEAARILNDGGTVAYLDFESDRASVARRLLDLGADKERIRTGFVYIRPEEAPATSVAASNAWSNVLARSWNLVVLDGVTEALALLAGKDSGGDPNERIAAFQQRYPTRIANETGAAVVSIDHVTKSSEGRGRHALGGQHKMNGLTGASYVVDVETQPQRGKVGVLLLRIAKDRPAGIRPHCGEFRKDRTQLAARVVVDSTSALNLTFEPPGTSTRGSDWQPTQAMEKCSRLLESVGEPISTTRIVDEVGMRKATVVAALTALTDGNYVTRTTGAHGAILYQHRQVFREQDVGDDAGQNPPVPVPALGTGNREQVEDGDSVLFPEHQGTGREQAKTHACPGASCRYCAEVPA